MKFQYRKLSREERKGSKWKYEVTETYIHEIDLGGIELAVRDKAGGVVFWYSPRTKRLYIGPGYRWDGPSGPTFDTESFMRGSAVHDALCQLTDLGLLDWIYREIADKELVIITKEDGMGWLRRQWVYAGVRLWSWWKQITNPRRHPRGKIIEV
ncbi:hypothetical protein LCGC14_0403340 [marine sediment metagenome]|uniref:DUF1353 domain-containing protein n=1 Tax=marine sediment metagenome TaxID=412755 RepID=A0A0F9VI19_9ZZZZ